MLLYLYPAESENCTEHHWKLMKLWNFEVESSRKATLSRSRRNTNDKRFWQLRIMIEVFPSERIWFYDSPPTSPKAQVSTPRDMPPTGQVPGLNPGQAVESTELENGRGRGNFWWSSEMRRDRKEHQRRKHSAGPRGSRKYIPGSSSVVIALFAVFPVIILEL